VSLTPSFSPIGLQPGEGGPLWFLGTLMTLKPTAPTTAGRVAVIEHLAGPASARRSTSTGGRTSGSP
jgi:hypothetical protein